MKKRILIACDLEGVNHVVGSPYLGLNGTPEQKDLAASQAALEINAAAEALFEAGVECVDLWDNHAGGGNINPENLDPRVNLLAVDRTLPRMSFATDYDCIFFFGYHAMEGTLGGVLAHTMNSKAVQYYKINGKYIGEIDLDSYIAASKGMASCFFAGGDITCKQAEAAVPGIVTVVTKEEISRNEANFRDNQELFADIKREAVKAIFADVPLKKLTFPAVMEKSFKRTEDAAIYLKRLLNSGIESEHPLCEPMGRDAHTVVSKINSIAELITCI